MELAIEGGTTVLTEQGDPLEAVEVVEVPETGWPQPPAGEVIVAAFDFGPDGATFSPAMTITLEYDPAQIPEGVAEEDLVVAVYNSGTGEWEYLPVTVDTENNTVTADVRHFTVFSILSPAEEEASSFPWAVVGPIIAIVVIAGVAFYLMRRRKAPGPATA